MPFVQTSPPSTSTLRYGAFLYELAALLRQSRVATTLGARCSASGARDLGDGAVAVRPEVGRVLTFVDEHMGERLSLQRLAAEAGLSTHHFARVFREETGTTPWAYVRAARVQKARELLREDRPLAEIALACGFCDQSHLTRAFKRNEGVTPGTYRKNLQERETQAA